MQKSFPTRTFCTLLSVFTCFFFCASLLSTAEVETSKVFCAAFKAAGLYTVLVRPVDVDNTYQYKFNFLKMYQAFMITCLSTKLNFKTLLSKFSTLK